MITIDHITDNKDGNVTIQSHDDQRNYTNIIGLVSSPTPDNATSQENVAYYKAYVESTIPPAPAIVYGG